jgi:flagellum-specific ATP synthase
MTALAEHIDSVYSILSLRVRGRVSGIAGLTIEASDLSLPLGSLCRINSAGRGACLAEVIGFAGQATLLMPLGSVAGVNRGDSIENVSGAPRIVCCPQMLGRVLDGFGRPIDELGALPPGVARRIDGRGVRPMQRRNIREPIGTGIRCIDALQTCGLGQRLAILSGPGVGKSTLLSSIARNTSADVSVVALIGERGREVQEFLHNVLGSEGRARSVVVVSTSDDPPLLRVRAAKAACAICEYFRDLGKNVLLLMDSLTRLAQAQRQIGLAAREPPATRGYPPSVFAMLPEVLERAGKTETGSITGFYTVLVEGDDINEPIPDAVKGISDGHLWLSRAMANRSHFPAIDLLQSISRVRQDVTDKPHRQAAVRILALTAAYQEIEDLINIGAFVRGASLDNDLAVDARPKILAFLQQEPSVACTIAQSRKQLLELTAWIDGRERELRSMAAKQARSPQRAPAPQPAG